MRDIFIKVCKDFVFCLRCWLSSSSVTRLLCNLSWPLPVLPWKLALIIMTTVLTTDYWLYYKPVMPMRIWSCMVAARPLAHASDFRWTLQYPKSAGWKVEELDGMTRCLVCQSWEGCKMMVSGEVYCMEWNGRVWKAGGAPSNEQPGLAHLCVFVFVFPSVFCLFIWMVGSAKAGSAGSNEQPRLGHLWAEPLGPGRPNATNRCPLDPLCTIPLCTTVPSHYALCYYAQVLHCTAQQLMHTMPGGQTPLHWLM